jgi:hypothetical protein
MAESSLPWAGEITGDCGPYSDDQWTDTWRKLFLLDRTTQGVLLGYGNDLVVTGTTSPVAVNTGAAQVDGKFYENTASVNVVIPTPAGATRIDRIVLRKDFAGQTVRITRIAGTEGAGAPALVQTDGTTWDIPIAQASITTGGIITVTDGRVFLSSDMGPGLIRYVGLVCFSLKDSEPCAVGDGAAYLHIPAELVGFDLVEAHSYVRTPGTTGTMDIQIANVTQAVDMLTTKLKIDSAENGSETAATPYVIDTANDDVAADDVLRVDVDVLHTTPALGLLVSLGFRRHHT